MFDWFRTFNIISNINIFQMKKLRWKKLRWFVQNVLLYKETVTDQIIKKPPHTFTHVASSPHTDVCVIEVLHSLKCLIGINSSYIGTLCPTRHPPCTVWLATYNWSSIWCKTWIHLPIEIAECNACIWKYSIQWIWYKGYVGEALPTSNRVKLKWIYFRDISLSSGTCN